MKIFLCGQRSFGKEVCRALLDAGHEIVGVAPAPPQKHQDKLRRSCSRPSTWVLFPMTLPGGPLFGATSPSSFRT